MICCIKLKIIIKCIKLEGDIEMNNELINLTESELLSINGGDGFFSTVGTYVGKALAYACRGMETTSTAWQVNEYNRQNQ